MMLSDIIGRDTYPSQEELLEFFRYEPETGKIYWKKILVRNQVRVGDEAFYQEFNGRLSGQFKRKTLYAHLVAWKMIYGTMPLVYHKNGNALDNRLENLASVDPCEGSKIRELSEFYSKKLKAQNGCRLLPPIELLEQWIRYEPTTGNLFYKKLDIEWFSGPNRVALFNDREKNSERLVTARHVTGYVYPRIRQVGYIGSRVAWYLHTGVDPAENEIDHINGVRDDNRLLNLRLVNRTGNMKNKRIYKNNSSGCTGVRLEYGKWVALINVDGTAIRLGVFGSKQEAIACRLAAESQYGVTTRK